MRKLFVGLVALVGLFVCADSVKAGCNTVSVSGYNAFQFRAAPSYGIGTCGVSTCAAPSPAPVVDPDPPLALGVNAGYACSTVASAASYAVPQFALGVNYGVRFNRFDNHRVEFVRVNRKFVRVGNAKPPLAAINVLGVKAQVGGGAALKLNVLGLVKLQVGRGK